MIVIKKSLILQGNVYLCLLSLCYFLLLCSVSQANELVNLILHDEVYTFVKRLAARDLVEKGLGTTQPMTRREIAQVLIEVAEKYQSGQIGLTDVESKQLWHFLRLFVDEIESLKPGFLSLMKKRHTLTVKGEDSRVDLDLRVKQEGAFAKPSSGERQNTSITSTDMILRAKVGQHLGVSSILHSRLLLGSDAYNPYRKEVTTLSSTSRGEEVHTLSGVEAYAVVALPWLSLQWGIDELWWGPGWHGALLISDNSAPKDTLKLFGSIGPIRFTYLTAILRESMLHEYHPRYMSAHRLEFLPYRGVNIGLNEVVVFADRYDLHYLNPFAVLFTSQVEELKNNMMLGVDLDITLVPSVELYTEVMVDDFQIQEGLESFRVWNSKYGILFGGYWVDPFGLRDTDVRMEYAFVNQYAYTHKYEVTRYTHQGLVIGHWMGTDADDLWVDIKHWVTDRIRIVLTYERERQGEDNASKEYIFDPRTGDIPEGLKPSKHWEFLSGIAESTHSFSVGLSYISIGRYSTGIEYTNSQIRNAGHKLGVDGKEHQLIVKAEYRF